MKRFSENLREFYVEEGNIGVAFLGQAGFVFKTSDQRMYAVDPYLSNCCERYFGFKRLMPRILLPEEVTFDAVIATHAHYDHFDPDSMPTMLKNGKTEFIGALDTKEECDKLNIQTNTTFLAVGDNIERNLIKLTAVPCDHGVDTPHAIGLLIESAGKKIYIMGDTSYRPDYLENELLKDVDLLILPINGAFGNLNEEQAAKVISVLQPQMAIPCHYWNFAEHGGNPGIFQKKMKEYAPNIPYTLMFQSEMMTI